MKSIKTLRVILLSLAALMGGSSLQAQNDSIAPIHHSAEDLAAHEAATQAPRRKKVGVVLSGGGAKGMAHIGVLKVLERAGIPVDVITGTSMGSIIGGLYAIGYNAEALDSLVMKQDWGYVITDKENLRNQSLDDREKSNTYVFSTGFAFGKRDKNAGGLVKGKNLAELFQRVCMGYNDSLDFNKDLCIPFACVATNIVDNSEVDFHSGRLWQCMRASMAIPAVFAPVRMGDMVLVDGGLKNNYPADLAREMGAEVIIGVTVQGDAKTAEDLGGTLSIIGQIVDINCKNKVEENLAITDLHMKVDVRGYSTGSFTTEAIDSLIDRGELAGNQHWDEIIALKKKIGIDDTFRPVIHQPLRPKVLTEKQYVKSYNFGNLTKHDEQFLRRKFKLDKNDSIDATTVQLITTCLRMDLFYQSAECDVIPESDGVRVEMSVGNRKSMLLHIGARYDQEEHAALQLGATVPLRTSIPVNTELTVRLGKRIFAKGEFTVHPAFFTRPKLSYTFRHYDVDVYKDGDLDFDIRYDQHQAELTPFNFDLRNFNVQVGLRWDRFHYRDKLGADGAAMLTLPDQNFFSYRARVNYNSEDQWYFPTQGARFRAEYAYLTNDFTQLDVLDADGNKVGKVNGMHEVSADWRMSFTIGKRFTLQPMLYGRLLFLSDVDLIPRGFCNTLGGSWFGHYIEQQMPFAGIGNMEYVQNHFVAAQLQAQERIGKKHYILLRAAVGAQSDRVGGIFDNKALIGGQIAYYYNTIFGPVGAAFGYSNHTKKVDFFLNLGHVF